MGDVAGMKAIASCAARTPPKATRLWLNTWSRSYFRSVLSWDCWNLAHEVAVEVVPERDGMADEVFNETERVVGKDDIGRAMVAKEVAPEGREGGFALQRRGRCSHGAVLLEQVDGGGCENEAEGCQDELGLAAWDDGGGGRILVRRGEDGHEMVGGPGRLLGGGDAPVEEGLVASAGNFEHQGFMGAVGCEVGVDAFAQLGCVDADNVVLTTVVGRRAAEDVGAYVLFVDLGMAVFQGLVADVEQEIAQTGGPPEMLAGGDPLNQGAPLVDAGQLVFGIDWGVSGGTHRESASETNRLIAEAAV